MGILRKISKKSRKFQKQDFWAFYENEVMKSLVLCENGLKWKHLLSSQVWENSGSYVKARMLSASQ